MIHFPFTTTVIEVSQPLATFYAAVLPAELLLQTSFSDTLRAIRDETGAYSLQGVQRLIDDDRIRAIGSYISRTDSAFPNSIILAANYLAEGFVEDRPDHKWRIERDRHGTLTLTIPSADQMVAIIDGQHRLFGFARASENRLPMQLLCSIYLDLPKPYQAQLFATINSTQKKVSKSLTYELFGYNISDEDSDHWAPDKLV
jgi:DNA phosphorothioation-associated DGQHR protein 1